MNSLKSIPMQKWLQIFAIFFIFALYGCSDDSLTEGSCVTSLEEESNFCIKIVDSNNEMVRSVQTKSTSTIIATLTTKNDEAIDNILVTFSSNIGTLDPVSGTALTNTNGNASVKLITGNTIEAGTIIATVRNEKIPTVTEYTFSIGGSSETTVVDDITETTNDTTGSDISIDNTDSTEVDDTIDTSDNNVSNSVTGAVEFLSSTPSSITLRGTGGTDLTEFSTVTFRVIGSDGLPMAGRTVNFSLETEVGGIDIYPTSAISTSEGIVSTTLQAGNIPTSVRVTASTQITDIDGVLQEVFSQSDQLIISTGIPDQNSMTISIATQNPQAWNFDGVEVDVVARLADHFNNRVPDGTTVYFTTEGGAIEPSCQTLNGECKVVWRSQDPRPIDHRVTILATAIGTESFYDADGNGKYTLADGEPYIDANGNNVFDEAFTDSNSNSIFDEPFLSAKNGLWDEGEAFTDQLNGRYDLGESFTDIGNGKYDAGETYTDDNPANGQYDTGEAFVDLGDGIRQKDEEYVDAKNGIYDAGEPFVDEANNIYELRDIFIDYNNNGKYDGEGNNPDGETIFIDSNNGNSLYDGSGLNPNGENYTDVTNNSKFDGPGFNDLPEPFLDANENFSYDVGEMYVDTNNNGVYDETGDGKYNGILCVKNNNCSSNKTLHVRDSAVLIMSSSAAIITAIDAHRNIVYGTNDANLIKNLTDNGKNASNVIDASKGKSRTITIYVSDTAGQIMPELTSVSMITNVGKVTGTISTDIENSIGSPNINRGPNSSESFQGGRPVLTFTIEDSDPHTLQYGFLRIDVIPPNKEITQLFLEIDI